MGRKQLAFLATVAGIAGVVGVFLPWVTFMGSSANGTEEELNGVWVLILGGVGTLLAFRAYSGKPQAVNMGAKQALFGAVLLLGLAGILAATDFFRDDWGPASKGLGIWLSLLGCLGGAVAALMAANKPDAA
jgi:hypothetical protein